MILTVRKKGIATLSCMCAATEGNQGGEQLARAGDLAAAGVFCSLCSGRRQGGWSRNNCRDGGLADRLLQRRKQGEGHPRERKREARSSAAFLMALGGDGEVSSAERARMAAAYGGGEGQGARTRVRDVSSLGGERSARGDDCRNRARRRSSALCVFVRLKRGGLERTRSVHTGSVSAIFSHNSVRQ